MAEIVIPAQVLQQLIIIEVTVITEFAEWVSSVAGVIRVAMSSVTSELLTIVPFPFVRKDLVRNQNFWLKS